MSIPIAISYVALWVLVILQMLVLLGVVRALYEVRQRFRAAESAEFEGQPVPEFAAVDLSGQTVSSSTLAGAAAVLLFVSPNCQTCMVALNELHVLASDPARQLVLFCHATEEDSRRLAADFGVTAPVVADRDGVVKRLFGVSSTPMAVRIGVDGRIESHGSPVRGDGFAELVEGAGAR
jgi:peroxiredoxin